MTIDIELTQGKVASIDDDNNDLKENNWYAHKPRNTFYGVDEK